MSYIESNFYRNPGPVYGGSDKDEPVPGWGPLPNMAGASRVGVGAVDLQVAPKEGAVVFHDNGAPAQPWPWYVWPLGGAVVGASLALARNAGKLKFLARMGR